MWSASSRTVTSTSASEHERRSIRSTSRPGVATRMSTPRSRELICLLIGRPPATRRTDRLREDASGVSASVTCIASSRVGTRIRPRGRRGVLTRPSSRAISGRPKASVLPEPVAARPRTSRPATMSGMTAAWIGNGDGMPARPSAVTSEFGRPRAAKPGRFSVGTTCTGRSSQMERARTAGRRTGAGRRGADGRRAELVEPREAGFALVAWLARLDWRPRAGADVVERVKTFLRELVGKWRVPVNRADEAAGETCPTQRRTCVAGADRARRAARSASNGACQLGNSLPGGRHSRCRLAGGLTGAYARAGDLRRIDAYRHPPHRARKPSAPAIPTTVDVASQCPGSGMTSPVEVS